MTRSTAYVDPLGAARITTPRIRFGITSFQGPTVDDSHKTLVAAAEAMKTSSFNEFLNCGESLDMLIAETPPGLMACAGQPFDEINRRESIANTQVANYTVTAIEQGSSLCRSD